MKENRIVSLLNNWVSLVGKLCREVKEKRKGFTLIGPKDHDRTEGSWRERLHKRGFTLIELIVVMAILGIIIMLAAPKFLGYAHKAKDTQMKQAIKVSEQRLESYLVKHGGLPNAWMNKPIEELEALLLENKLFEKNGPAQTIKIGNYKIIDEDGLEDIGLAIDAEFYASKNGKIYVSYQGADVASEPADGADNPVTPSIEDLVLKISDVTEAYSTTYPSFESEAAISDAKIVIANEFATVDDIQSAIAALETAKANLIPILTAADPNMMGFIFNTETNTITGYTGTIKDVIIPASFLVDGVLYDVVNIGSSAFQSKGLNSLVIHENIKSLGKQAFAKNPLNGGVIFNTNLTSSYVYYNLYYTPFEDTYIGKLTITDTVTSIPASLFNDAGLTSVVIPASVKTIGSYAFRGNKIAELNIPETVTSIGAYAFSKNYITDYQIPEYMTSVPTGFLQYNRLINLTIPSHVKSLGREAFANNSLSGEVILDSDITSVYSYANINYTPFADTYIGTLTITDNVTNIPASLFNDAGLTSVAIPASVKSIGSYAFHDNRLTTINIPETVTSLGTYSFAKNYITDYQIPEYMTSIPSGFLRYNRLINLTIPSHVKSLGRESFANNSLSGEVILDSDITSVYVYANINYTPFADTYIGKLTITDNVTTIPASLFNDAGLTSVVIPASVKTIGSYAFHDNRLTSINIPETVTSLGTYSFAKNYITDYQIPEYMTSIPSGFLRYNRLINLTIPSHVKSLGRESFANNSLSGEVILDSDIASVYSYANMYYTPFADTYIGTLTITDNVTSIPASIFNDAGLTSVAIPASVTSIGNYAFYDNKIPQDLAIIKNIEGSVVIGTNAFGKNTSTGGVAITPIYQP